jgi:hypothetical protein
MPFFVFSTSLLSLSKKSKRQIRLTIEDVKFRFILILIKKNKSKLQILSNNSYSTWKWRLFDSIVIRRFW